MTRSLEQNCCLSHWSFRERERKPACLCCLLSLQCGVKVPPSIPSSPCGGRGISLISLHGREVGHKSRNKRKDVICEVGVSRLRFISGQNKQLF